jgi:hypothetical protein
MRSAQEGKVYLIKIRGLTFRASLQLDVEYDSGSKRPGQSFQVLIFIELGVESG